MANVEPEGPRPEWRDWLAPRVERRLWRLASGEIVDGATYRVVGGQHEAFEALRSFGAGHVEPIVVDLDGLNDRMRSSFLDFLERTGLTPLEWINDDVVVLAASSGGDGGGAGVREPVEPTPPLSHLATEAPLPSDR